MHIGLTEIKTVGELKAALAAFPDDMPTDVYKGGNGDHVPLWVRSIDPSDFGEDELEIKALYPIGCFVIDAD